MILLNDVVHVLAGPSLAFLGSSFFLLQITDGTNIGGILVNIDYSWGGDVGSAQDFSEKSLGCSSAAGLVQEEIKCLAGGVNSSIEIHPLTPNFDVGFIDPPRIIGLLQIRATAFVYFWSISLDPAVDGGVIHR